MSRIKNPDADLEKKRGMFFQIGLTVALAAALLVINYETPVPEQEKTTTRISGLEVEKVAPEGDSLTRIAPPQAFFDK